MNQLGSIMPKNLTVLLAHDDAGIQLTLLEQKGFVVITVGNGVEAVEAISASKFNSR